MVENGRVGVELPVRGPHVDVVAPAPAQVQAQDEGVLRELPLPLDLAQVAHLDVADAVPSATWKGGALQHAWRQENAAAARRHDVLPVAGEGAHCEPQLHWATKHRQPAFESVLRLDPRVATHLAADGLVVFPEAPLPTQIHHAIAGCGHYVFPNACTIPCAQAPGRRVIAAPRGRAARRLGQQIHQTARHRRANRAASWQCACEADADLDIRPVSQTRPVARIRDA
mmetsp:Transcript_88431/g.249188  ORF Transcript_88431/g.249188 Transcript_88431/m.249188 type:complete len:227 (+) Transcript_88431:564-1244(+)|eukprot:CAMPEP_0117521414 /NCGR_PEP_ID=MMETSP0784-20121206/33672_1 /TAXON_ID=39447 /ORGANISM="" /LENGTH=226 /DNA_ID=CAMNT_0005317439 /DNA_START=523 /DNA_END=1203 /DNA_ORIENTATION=-